MQKLVRDIRNAEQSLGVNEKSLSAMEMLNRHVLRKSLVAGEALSVGTVVSRDMVQVKGPGKGLSPQRIDELIGAKLERDLVTEEYFAEGDLRTGTNETIPVHQLRTRWGLKARFHDLLETIEKKPRVVELHFSDQDVDYEFTPPAEPFSQQLFVHAPEFSQSRLLDLCSTDEEVRERAIGLMQRTVDKAVELRPHFTGSVAVVIHVGGMSMDEPILDRKHLLRRAVDSFNRIESKGITLLPENLPPRPWYLGGQWFQNVFIRPEEMIDFCQELKVGMTLDISHAQLYCTHYGESLYDFVQQCLPYAKHLHISDATGIDGEGVQIGEGVVEWEKITELLTKKDFTWVPEIWSGHLHNGAGFVEAINRLTKYGSF